MKAFSPTRLLLVFFVLTCAAATAQELTVIKDFRNEWEVFQNERYLPYAERRGSVNTIYFSIESNVYPANTFLQVSSSEAVALFVNGQLITKTDVPLALRLDSLREVVHATVLQVSIFQRKINESGLHTTLASRQAATGPDADLTPIQFSSFRDFATVGFLILMVMLIIIIQLNPKLAADYFSVTKIFSMREGEDSQAYSRITSSINILFYAYSSLMLGYYLMIVFHFLSAEYTIALTFEAHTFWEAIVRWIELSLVILTLFFLKIILVYGLSYVFGMREIGGIHFFNWVRLLLGVFGVLTIVLFLYFISHGDREGFYDFLLGIMSWVLAGWTILIILKLSRQMDHSIFHLFSYICATELIPFLITIKVLYY